MLLTNDAEELAIWDLRNLNKRLFTIKCSNLGEAEFYKAKGGYVLISRQNNIELIDLANYKGEEVNEKNGISVSLLVFVSRSCFP